MRSPVDEDIITLGQFFCDNIGNWLSELLNKVQKYDSDFKVKRSNWCQRQSNSEKRISNGAYWNWI